MFNGAKQLQKLTIRYCDWGGSSAKVRQFVATELTKLRELEPEIVIETTVVRNKHPIVIGEFKQGRLVRSGERLPKVLELRQAEDVSEIWSKINFLRWETGMKARPITDVKQSKVPSIQGEWNPFVRIE